MSQRVLEQVAVSTLLVRYRCTAKADVVALVEAAPLVVVLDAVVVAAPFPQKCAVDADRKSVV